METRERLKALLKSRFPRGLRVALRTLQQEFQAMRLHRQGLRQIRAYRGRTSLKLNIGCGPNQKPGWVNIDLIPNVDLSLDMREKLPLEDGCATIVYSEHFFEHLDYPVDAKHFLHECHRVLERGGIISIGVPDTRWPLEAYFGLQDQEYFQFVKKYWHPGWCQTPMEHINYHFRQDTQHRFAYDFETLKRALEECGFSNIHHREFDSGLDTARRKKGTLYVDAHKP